jgi:hypothetical protein
MTQMPPPTGPVAYGAPTPSQSTGLAVGSLICGIVSIVLFCMWFISIPAGLVAIALAYVARGKIARGEAGGAGLAKAGLICGIVGVVLAVLLNILAFAGLHMLGNWAEKQNRQMNQQQRTSTTQPSAE